MTNLSSGSEVGRIDEHRPVEFQPENYEFVGCFHNTYTFTHGRNHSALQTRKEFLVSLLDSNWRPNGPGYTNCDHCGAHIAFCGVFKNIVSGDYIVVGSVCADKRFPMSNDQFQALRKAHRLCRVVDLASAKFEEFKIQHPEVDWAAAEASTDGQIRFALSQGRKYGSLYDYRLQQITAYLDAAARNAQVAAAAPVAAPAPVSAELSFLRAYTGTNSFLRSLKDQDAQGRTLSPKQLACVTNNIAQAQRAIDPAAQALKAANQQLVPGIYVAKDRTIWKVQGNQQYKSGVKNALRLKIPFDATQVRGAALYAMVWSANAAPLTLDEVGDLSTSQGWVYVKGGIATLDIDHQMTLDEAKHFATLYSQCVWCGATLENTASYGTKFIEQGIGPVCIRYIDNTTRSPEIDHG